MNELDKLAIIYGTDKSSQTHDYCNKYEKYLPFKRDDKIKILEIGVLDGSSTRMWKKYYKNAEIIGIDIEKRCKEHEEDRIVVEIGSQNDLNFLQKIIEKHGPFDFILDDGSHMNSDVIFSFEHLFNSVTSNGVYIVEDSATSYYPDYGGGRDKKGTTMEFFKDLVDEVNFFGEFVEKKDPTTNETKRYLFRRDKDLIEQFKEQEKYNIGRKIESLNFLNSLIIITKR